MVLVAENLPNQADLNRSGYDGFSQWADLFHDKMKALLREGVFPNHHLPTTDRLGDIFYFSRAALRRAHQQRPQLRRKPRRDQRPLRGGHQPGHPTTPATKDRKGRLGLFATVVAWASR